MARARNNGNAPSRIARAAMTEDLHGLCAALARCRICAPRFAGTATAHAPRPLVHLRPGVRLLIASQAPGRRCHEGSAPFADGSGHRLRAWLGLSDRDFHDESRVAIVPMALCFPGQDAQGNDLPPPAVCRKTWHRPLMAALGPVPLLLAVGGSAQRWHLGVRSGVTETVRDGRSHWPSAVPLPHPSWRNTAWIARNPWFEAELLPALRTRVAQVMDG